MKILHSKRLAFVFPQAATMGIKVTNQMSLFGSNLTLLVGL